MIVIHAKINPVQSLSGLGSSGFGATGANEESGSIEAAANSGVVAVADTTDSSVAMVIGLDSPSMILRPCLWVAGELVATGREKLPKTTDFYHGEESIGRRITPARLTRDEGSQKPGDYPFVVLISPADVCADPDSIDWITAFSL